MTGAFRVDDSGRRFDGTSTTETVGLEVRPVSSLLLRATTSSSFKSPSTFTVSGEPNLTLADVPFLQVTDPRIGGETLFVGGIFGVGQSLDPETGRSNTVGLVWMPKSLAGLELSVTAWENRLRDRVAFVDHQFLVDNEDLFPDRVMRDPETGMITAVDIRAINIARTDVEGIDLSASWRWPTRYGVFTPSLAATWVGKHDEQITPDSPVEDRLAVLNLASSDGWSPRWKGTTSLNWELSDQVQATMIGRYVSNYEDPRPLDTGPNAGTLQTLGDFWLFDLNVDMAVGRWLVSRASPLSGARLSIGAQNLFDRLPDFCNTCTELGSFVLVGYDSTQYDLIGRRASVELRFSF